MVEWRLWIGGMADNPAANDPRGHRRVLADRRLSDEHGQELQLAVPPASEALGEVVGATAQPAHGQTRSRPYHAGHLPQASIDGSSAIADMDWVRSACVRFYSNCAQLHVWRA